MKAYCGYNTTPLTMKSFLKPDHSSQFCLVDQTWGRFCIFSQGTYNHNGFAINKMLKSWRCCDTVQLLVSYPQSAALYEMNSYFFDTFLFSLIVNRIYSLPTYFGCIVNIIRMRTELYSSLLSQSIFDSM